MLIDGQTSSGKTFTMEGPDLYNEDLKGIIPRSIKRIFEIINELGSEVTFSIKVSYTELCNMKLIYYLSI